MFAATYIEKTACVDDFETGCETKSVCTMSEKIHLVGKTMKDLIDKLAGNYCLDIDSVFLPCEGEITHIQFNRLENADGYEPSEKERDQWEHGKCVLFLADYTFGLEKYETQEITKADFEGVTVHG